MILIGSMFRLEIIQLIQAVGGGLLNKISEIWWKDLSWLQVKENWPRQPDIKPSVEPEKEVKISKERKSIFFITNEI